ncbi:hypothetical protein BD408DRAFT_413616 [Parasitella parasitica]|nr:hypothetical protein BD408DRAFT_413616 [Parasitella parasitica]
MNFYILALSSKSNPIILTWIIIKDILYLILRFDNLNSFVDNRKNRLKTLFHTFILCKQPTCQMFGIFKLLAHYATAILHSNCKFRETIWCGSSRAKKIIKSAIVGCSLFIQCFNFTQRI